MAETVRRLFELEPGDQSDFFVLLVAKDKGTTRDGKPYYRVTLRDPQRTVTAMIWNDAGWFDDFDQTWRPGQFFKIRGRYLENKYGSQIEIEQIRPTKEEDSADGFDQSDFFETSRRDPGQMFDELIEIAAEIEETPLRELVTSILKENEEPLLKWPAASKNHHAFSGGFLEHVLSVTRTAIYLADKYQQEYPALKPPLSKDLMIAGAILHDIGKLQELSHMPPVTNYTPSGKLIGHILLGRDMVRDAGKEIENLNPETLLRLEHIIVSHQNLPEWGSPIAPHTPEALLVHYADDIDAKFQMMAGALSEMPSDDDPFTSRSNPLRRTIFRGFAESD
ncbi:MAG: HD domain-containing protein [Planctomycetaceae bacterium]|nr:HD domain-containing protein [Planctomycetaceae bacterium]